MNRVGRSTAQNGGGPESTIGEGTGTFAVKTGGKDDQFRSDEPHYVSIRPQEDRSGSAGEVGEV